MSIPILDLQAMDHTRLDAACRQWGFFGLQGHGIDKNLWQAAFDQSRRFFEQPLDAKNVIRRAADNAWGFYDAELTKNRRDWKEILDIGEAAMEGPLAGSVPQWPELPEFREVISAFTNALHTVGLRLLDELAAAMGTSINLRAPFDTHSSFIRLNYYPPCDDPAPADADFVPQRGELGISHHTDAGAVTVLAQDEHPGLQVFHGDAWHTVPPHADTLIINIGDIVQVWSNDRYLAPLHRVLASSDHARISIPYFLNPDYRAMTTHRCRI